MLVDLNYWNSRAGRTAAMPAGVAWQSAFAQHHLKAVTMDHSDNSIQIFDGGREVLERAYLWAIVFDRPSKQSLARRLEPSANDALSTVAPDPDESN